MAIKVQNKNDIGNPYHSEETGQFVSAEYASQAGYEDIKSYDKMSNKITSDYDISSVFVEDDEDSELARFWKQLNGEKVQKKIEEMSNQELIEEIKECYEFFMEKGLDFSGFSDCFNGDLQLKCINFRQLKHLMEKYPIPLKGCKFVVNNRYHSKYTTWARTYGLGRFGNSLKVNYKMEFNGKAFKNYKENKEDVRDSIRSGHWSDCADGKEGAQTISHEYGHMIQAYLIINEGYLSEDEILYSDNVVEKIRQVQTTMKEDIRQRYYEKYKSYTDFEKEISKYGKTNSPEFFAETFASLMCGKPTKTALIMEEWLKQFF